MLFRSMPLKEFLRRAEREYLAQVLRRHRGGIGATARHALVDAATLHRKMKAHGIRREDFRTRVRAREAEPTGIVGPPPGTTRH